MGSAATRTTTKTTSEAKSGAEGDTTNPTDSKTHIVDGIDKCKPGTDRELSFSDNVLDFTDCYKDFYKDSDFTGHTVDLTNCTKLADVQKRHMSNREGLQYTTFPQIESSTLQATQPTSGSQKSPALQTTMPTIFCLLMPPPSTQGSPMFEGANVTEFLERYKDLCSNYQVLDEDRLSQLP
jgi:hypothetical protein